MRPQGSVTPQIAPQAVLEVCFCHHVRRTARAVTRIFDEALQPTGLKAGQFNILAAISARESSSVGELVGLLAMDRTTLSRNLKPLREAGYLNAQGGAGRRPDALTLTTAGHALLSQAMIHWQEAQGGLSQRLGANQASMLLQTLEGTMRVIG